MTRVGAALLAIVAAVALAAPWLAPHAPDRRFPDLLYAPPTRVHLAGTDGSYRLQIHPWRLVSRIERRFEEATERPVALRWFTGGSLVTAAPEAGAPLLLLGADAYGRDIFSRMVHGSRVTLLLALLATVAATLLGGLIGAVSGFAGGRVDALLSRMSELIIVLPMLYVALALRAVMPLVLPPAAIFAVLLAVFTLVGWPIVARGVRAIVAAERSREYAMAASALGASRRRILARHLLPAAIPHMAVQATLLLPAFILAESTLSYVGFGFPDTHPTWGTMLKEASNPSLFADSPWMLAPAAAIFAVVLATNLLVQGTGRAPVQLER
jgi:peptide/nickel transport system permease protein